MKSNPGSNSKTQQKLRKFIEDDMKIKQTMYPEIYETFKKRVRDALIDDYFNKRRINITMSNFEAQTNV